MISIIVAYSKNRVIGKNGKIPWNIKADMQHFKNLTTGNVLIMGRNTFEEIGHPLSNRYTIIVSSSKNFDSENSKTVHSFEDALIEAKKIVLENLAYIGKNIFVCGGQRIYKSAIPFTEKLYVTEIDAEIEGDAYFPEFDDSQFKLVSKVSEQDSNFSFSFLEYNRI